MTVARALLVYDVAVGVVLTADFVLWRRRSTSLTPTLPAVVLVAALAAAAVRAEFPLAVIASGAVVLGSALFAYANFLAFVKRGVTFSILRNHAQPSSRRLRDDEFIAVDQRLEEMRGHGWIADGLGGWALTRQGRRVLDVRRGLLRLLRTETIG